MANHESWGVIPTHNEEKNIGIALEELRKSLRDLYDYVAVVVDDSKDKTALEAIKHGAKVIRLDKRVGKGTTVITGIREVLKYDVDCVVVNDDEQYPMHYVPKFLEALDEADAAFAYSPKRKGIFSRFMNAITGCDYDWAVGLKAFRRELAEELAKAKPWYYVKWNYDVYSTLLPYIKGKKVKWGAGCGGEFEGKYDATTGHCVKCSGNMKTEEVLCSGSSKSGVCLTKI